MRYEYRECVAPDCGLRYPQSTDSLPGERCPRCGQPAQLRHRFDVIDTALSRTRPRRGAALFDNLRSAFNAGSMLRTADGVGLAHVYLCGTTAPASSAKVAKTALGAEVSVPSSHHRNAVVLARELQASGYRLRALEVGEGAVSVFDAPSLNDRDVLVVGNEVAGVDPDLLTLCEGLISIPMYGTKRSFNVAVAFGIAAAVLARPSPCEL